MKWILPLLLIALMIGSLFWYMFVYDRATVRDFLTAQARNSARNGHFDAAAWFYDLSYRFSGNDANVAIELSEIYREVGNYTKAESALTAAISDDPSAELYSALCRTYVEQDKLLDAVNMLDGITDPAIKAELDAQRPAAPSTNYEAGFYSQYITLTFTAGDGTLYVSDTGEYPSLEDAPSEGTLTLAGGDTKIYALTVGENGLVSPLTILHYTVGGVIEPVTLTDPAVEAALREQLLFAENTTIYTSDLWTITEFTVPADAGDLSDLSHLMYLESLTITDRSIASLDFLTSMIQLKELTLSGCSLSCGLEPIGALQTLRTLNLSGCGLSTIAGLENAVNLVHLDLSSNAVGKIDALSGMTMMETLDLSSNAVKDLTALGSMAQLKTLDLNSNAVSSLSPLAACTALTELDVSNNQLTSLSGLEHLSGLCVLSASNNDLTNVSALAECTALTQVELAHNTLTELPSLSGLTALTTLDFSYNEVSALPKLGSSSALVTLKADYNAISDITALGSVEGLNYVYLDYNQITDISPLTKCHNLIQLNVYGNAVSTAHVNKLLDMSVIVNYDPTMTSENNPEA